jgi:hypothetical protein
MRFWIRKIHLVAQTVFGNLEALQTNNNLSGLCLTILNDEIRINRVFIYCIYLMKKFEIRSSNKVYHANLRISLPGLWRTV